MEALEIIKYLRDQNFSVRVDGEYLDLSPSEKIKNELIERLRKHKPEILAELKREERRKKILNMLADKPDSQRVFITDLDSDFDNIILTIAIKDQYSFEMLMPKNKYDPFMILELISKGTMQ